MKFYNLRQSSQVVDYSTAVRKGLGENQGLFFPKNITPLANINELLDLPVNQRNFEILKPFVKENLSDQQLQEVIENTFTFPAAVGIYWVTSTLFGIAQQKYVNWKLDQPRVVKKVD